MSADSAADAARVLDYPLRWLHTPLGGYGYTMAVPCRVIRRGPKNVLIAALRNDGTEAERWVAPRHVRAPERDSARSASASGRADAANAKEEHA